MQLRRGHRLHSLAGEAIDPPTLHKFENLRYGGTQLLPEHRRRINTEEKANIPAAVWGKELIQFLAAPGRFKEQDEFLSLDEYILFFN